MVWDSSRDWQFQARAEHSGVANAEVSGKLMPATRDRALFGFDLAYVRVLGEGSDHELRTNLSSLTASCGSDWVHAMQQEDVCSRGGE